MLYPMVFVVGTRAQLIKVAPVVVATERVGRACTLLLTGQHRETMQDLVDEFGITAPQVSAVEAHEHATMFALMRWLPTAYRSVKARLRVLADGADGIDVLVHGDTLSTLIGAYAAHRLRARVVHLESGLTSGRLFDPFPEELCRRLVFRHTDVAMCPNPLAAKHMQRYQRARVVDTGGNTIVDAVALTGAAGIRPDPDAPYLVASLHRFQNIYNRRRLKDLVALIKDLASGVPVHFVLHPATRKRLQSDGLLEQLEQAPGVVLASRMGYGAFLRLAAGAACVLTDGGSNQEELAVLGVPTVVMRATTERPDGLGVNAIMEADVPGGVVEFIRSGAIASLRRNPIAPMRPGPSDRIVEFLAGSGRIGFDREAP